MKRREFMRGSVAAAVCGGLSPVATAPARAAWGTRGKVATLKLGSQIWRIPGETLRDKVLKLEAWGGVGAEIGNVSEDQVKEVKKALKGTSVKISAMYWGSCGGKLVSNDAQERTTGITALRKALKVAGDLDAVGVIFVPCFQGEISSKLERITEILLDTLPALGAYAKRQGTRVILLPLNSKETPYLNTTTQAISLCVEVNHPAVCMMGGFYHMGLDKVDECKTFVSAAKWLSHVHLASRTRVLPGQDRRSFVNGFRGLKAIGYNGYCSLECGILQNTNPEVEIPKSFRFLERQWQEAKV